MGRIFSKAKKRDSFFVIIINSDQAQEIGDHSLGAIDRVQKPFSIVLGKSSTANCTDALRYVSFKVCSHLVGSRTSFTINSGLDNFDLNSLALLI